MKYTLYDRLLKRELGDQSRYSKIRGLYGDKKWIDDLDIVNELEGHSGCVNALSWSRSGKLLASGSDDQHVNIHSYLPESSTSQFNFSTSISTGHTQNIFSVKFMPHSNDRTIVTAAGDGEVRIFDIEYSGQSSATSFASHAASTGRRRGLNTVYNGVRYLSDGDTNVKVFRSHSDRVKRIVTESSPYFFLTCSEDGEVRQWDLRQPESAYPPPRGHHRLMGSTASDDNVPPPLISYKRYHLDLNTISCSPSQPHYIALGGAHLHCFLHDRRMLGRDRLLERGTPLSPSDHSDHHDELMGQATQCVRKFAPNGQQRMRRSDNGHITACKISDANPNEMIVSWSGEWIYSFDLLRSPDARDATPETSGKATTVAGKSKIKESRERKRKRKRTKANSSVSQEGVQRGSSRARTESEPLAERTEGLSLMVQYGNGQSEEIPIEAPRARSPRSEAREVLIPESQRQSFRIAKGTVKIRKHMFSLGTPRQSTAVDPTGHATSFTSALGFAAWLLPDMDEIIRTWRYPVNPLEVDVVFQKRLKQNRCSARRFVQACGTLSRVLGGKLRTAGSGTSPALEYFSQIELAPNEGLSLERHEHFGYDFLKAILLWLDSGVGAVLQGFTRSPTVPRNHPRFPIPEDAGIDAIDDHLIPYLLQLAGKKPIPNIDASRFEVNERRTLFSSEKAAVLSFAQALKIPFEDLSSAVVPASSAESGASSVKGIAAQDRRAAMRFWGLKVGRGVLMNAGEGVNFQFVDLAFGGLGRADESVRADEARLSRQREEIDPNEEEEEEVVKGASVVRRRPQPEQTEVPPSTPAQELATTGEDTAQPTGTAASPHAQASSSEQTGSPLVSSQSTAEDGGDVQDPSEHVLEELVLTMSDVREAILGDADEEHTEGNEDGNEEEDDDDGGEDDEDDEDDDDSEDEEDEGSASRSGHFIWRSAFERSKLREKVGLHVPYSSHTRQYTGHCNVKTVKDVNFFGLQDEYVVSGSDSGHLFIWNKRTSQLLNILEGDGEVVNVVQGHPYEPMLAVSGIDHTIKIFSPDARARHDARNGIGVRPADPSSFSSLGLGQFRRRAMRRPAAATPGGPERREEEQEAEIDTDAEEEATPKGLSSRKRMHQEYQITSQNDVDRRGGGRSSGDAFITRSMLAHFAMRMRERAEGEGADENGTIVVQDEDCVVM